MLFFLPKRWTALLNLRWLSSARIGGVPYVGVGSHNPRDEDAQGDNNKAPFR